MLIGIISDTHDNVSSLAKAIEFFNRCPTDLVLHCGDWICPFTLGMYRLLNCPIRGVLGNGDPDIEKFKFQMGMKFQNLDMGLSERFLDISADGKRIAVFHGNDENLVNVILESQLFDLFCTGHTHVAKIEEHRRTTHLNPGTIIDFWIPDKPARPTVGLYDTKTASAEIIEL